MIEKSLRYIERQKIYNKMYINLCTLFYTSFCESERNWLHCANNWVTNKIVAHVTFQTITAYIKSSGHKVPNNPSKFYAFPENFRLFLRKTYLAIRRNARPNYMASRISRKRFPLPKKNVRLILLIENFCCKLAKRKLCDVFYEKTCCL